MCTEQSQPQPPVGGNRKYTGYLLALFIAVLVIYLLLSSWATGDDLGDYPHALKEAARTGKLLYVDFHAEWCPSCKLFERQVLNNSAGKKLLADFVVLRSDVDKYPRVADHFSVRNLPTHVVVDARTDPPMLLNRLEGAVSVQQFGRFLQAAKARAAKTSEAATAPVSRRRP